MKYQLRRQHKCVCVCVCTAYTYRYRYTPQSVFVGGSIYLLGTSSALVLTGCNYERPPSAVRVPPRCSIVYSSSSNRTRLFLLLYFTSRLNPTHTHEHTKEEEEEGCCAGRLKQQQQHEVKAKGQTRTSHFLFSLSKVKEAK